MGSDPRVSDTQIYRLGDKGNVTIAVTVGDAQVGETTLQLKGATTHLPAASTFPLGSADSLRDGILHTSTTVTDVNPATNRTEVTLHLAGGAADRGIFPPVHEVTPFRSWPGCPGLRRKDRIARPGSF